MSLDVDLVINGREVYSANITHNLNKMAMQCGVYEHIWRPEEIGVSKAKQLIEPLRACLNTLEKKGAEYFEQFEPENKWGTYAGFVSFVQEYLSACEDLPMADVEVCR